MNFSIHTSTLAAMGSLTQDTNVKALKEEMDMFDCIRNAYFFSDIFIRNFQYIFKIFKFWIFKHSVELKENSNPMLPWSCSSPGPRICLSICASLLPLFHLISEANQSELVPSVKQ